MIFIFHCTWVLSVWFYTQATCKEKKETRVTDHLKRNDCITPLLSSWDLLIVHNLWTWKEVCDIVVETACSICIKGRCNSVFWQSWDPVQEHIVEGGKSIQQLWGSLKMRTTQADHDHKALQVVSQLLLLSVFLNLTFKLFIENHEFCGF